MGQRIGAPVDLTASTLDDLAGDIDELRCLTMGALRRLQRARSEIERVRQAFQRRTLVTELAQLRSAEGVFSSYARDLRDCADALRRPRAGSIEHLRRVKNEYADLLRLQQSVVSALSVGSDWQSPVFESSGHPTAGRHSGLVREHLNDYKRDRHPQARAFEESFLREYVDVPPGLEVRALMTACGMAAFTTVLHYLCMTLDAQSPVVAARGMYHECRRLLADSPLGARVCWVDDVDTAGVVEVVRHLKPAALFLDSMCNSKGLAVPDSETIMFELAASARNDVTVVIDNTCGSLFSQRLHFAVLNPHLRPIVFESLTKYAQFGLDRAAAGIIVALEHEAEALDSLREHLGTNVADVCVSVIPEPNRVLLSHRLRRIERNTQLLAEHTMCHSTKRATPVAGATYPGLETHECYETARRLGFCGGFFAVKFRPEWDCAEGHERLVLTLIREARKRNVNLVAGASFGLNVTRVYRTATDTGLGPFVRVSAGTEDRIEVERLKEVFTSAMDALVI